MMTGTRNLLLLLLWAPGLPGAQAPHAAESLYQRTEYAAALRILESNGETSAAHWELIGKCHLMLGELKKATEYFEKAVAMEPRNSDHLLWLARSWARRAESATPLTAPIDAVKAREEMEKALELNPNNRDAMGDLFDYYLDAPGLLGGGVDKAEALARKIEGIDPAEGHFDLSRVAGKRQRNAEAEMELRTAVKLAPDQLGHVIGLARLLSREGKRNESDIVLADAERIRPDSPRLWYAKATLYIEGHRKIDEARMLLKKYLGAQLTPDDTPRAAAQKLLKKIGEN